MPPFGLAEVVGGGREFFQRIAKCGGCGFQSVGRICEAGRRDLLPDSFANLGGNLAGVDAVRDVAGELVKPLLDGMVKFAGGLLAGMDGTSSTGCRKKSDGAWLGSADLGGGLYRAVREVALEAVGQAALGGDPNALRLARGGPGDTHESGPLRARAETLGQKRKDAGLVARRDAGALGQHHDHGNDRA